MDNTIAAQVTGLGISLKNSHPSTAAKRGCELIITNTLATLLKLIDMTNAIVLTVMKKEDLSDAASIGMKGCVDFCSISKTTTLTLNNKPRQNNRVKESAEINRISKPSKLRTNTPVAVSKIPLIYSDIVSLIFINAQKTRQRPGFYTSS